MTVGCLDFFLQVSAIPCLKSITTCWTERVPFRPTRGSPISLSLASSNVFNAGLHARPSGTGTFHNRRQFASTHYPSGARVPFHPEYNLPLLKQRSFERYPRSKSSPRCYCTQTGSSLPCTPSEVVDRQ